jgi:ElaB/YqjD/DUF883 family membrane-anchored ribosome-binding protein
MTSKTESKRPASSDRVLEDLRTLVEDAELLMRETAGAAGERAQAARARAGESLRQARERLSGLEEELVAKAKDAARDVDGYVRENPWQSLGVAAAAGLLIGLLISRR